jgi:transposase-like protein
MGHLKQQVRYSEAFRLAVVKRVLSGEMSVIEACTHYGIGGKMSVYRWIKKYEQSEGISASSNPTTMAYGLPKTFPEFT